MLCKHPIHPSLPIISKIGWEMRSGFPENLKFNISEALRGPSGALVKGLRVKNFEFPFNMLCKHPIYPSLPIISKIGWEMRSGFPENLKFNISEALRGPSGALVRGLRVKNFEFPFNMFWKLLK